MSILYENLIFDAVDENGKVYFFEKTPITNGYKLTLKKETLSGIEKLYILPTLSKVNAGEEGYYVSSRNLDMTGDIQTFFKPRKDVKFIYNRPIQSVYFIKKPDFSCLVRIKRDRQYFLETIVKDNVYTFTPLYVFTDNPEDVYAPNSTNYTDVVLEVIFFDKGTDYNVGATTERELRLDRNEITTLSDKCKRPAVEYAKNYPLIRIRMGWKPSPSPVLHQTLETEPEMHVACDFNRVCDIADELKRQGVDGAELQLVGWNISGHDGRYPQIFPADPRLGGNDGLKKCIDYVKSLGYKISTHTNLIDATEIADVFTWDDIGVMRNGSYHQAGLYSGGLSYRVCPIKQLKNNRRDLPYLATFGEDGLHFTDVISISLPDPCYSKDHPCSTEDGIKLINQIMGETSDLFGGFSSEGCCDYALKYLDYGLYTSFGEGFKKLDIPVLDNYVPFYEVTYHGILMYNPLADTVNYPIKHKKFQLDLVMRGGRPSYYIFSKFRTGGESNWMGEIDLLATTDDDLRFTVSQVKKGLEEYKKLRDKQTLFIIDYKIFDDGIHVAYYSDGSFIAGNYSESVGMFNGKKIPPFGYIIG
ncbi:MAG: hypothetical protein J6B16_00330 [Clostridia bacterium]|nr:hypothetical protein [Clostridia bacterium]